MAEYESVWSDLQGVPFSQGYRDAGGVRTRYLHAGDPGKPALVLLHGSGGHAEAYVRNLESHAEHFSTWSIDMLGHGGRVGPRRQAALELAQDARLADPGLADQRHELWRALVEDALVDAIVRQVLEPISVLHAAGENVAHGSVARS